MCVQIYQNIPQKRCDETQCLNYNYVDVILLYKVQIINFGEWGGGVYKTVGGRRSDEVLTLQKVWGRKSYSHAEGGTQKVLG